MAAIGCPEKPPVPERKWIARNVRRSTRNMSKTHIPHTPHPLCSTTIERTAESQLYSSLSCTRKVRRSMRRSTKYEQDSHSSHSSPSLQYNRREDQVCAWWE